MLIHDLTTGRAPVQGSLLVLAPADPRQGRKRTYAGMGWRVYLDPDNWPMPRLAVRMVFEEYGQEVGSPRASLVPATGRGWFGPSRDVRIQACRAVLSLVRERTGIDYRFGEAMAYDTTAWRDDKRDMVEFPAEPLFLSHLPDWPKRHVLPERFRPGAAA
jgi:hypothetical protein